MVGVINGKNFSELPAEKFWSFSKSYKGNAKEETRYMVKSGEYLGSVKKDGFYSRLIKDDDGNKIMQGRSKNVEGEYLNKVEWMPQMNNFLNFLPNGTCLIGEVYFPKNEGSRKVTTILGCLKDKAIQRQEKGEKLCYYIFDIWAYGGESYMDKTIEERIEKLREIEQEFYTSDNEGIEFINFAQYYDGSYLWQILLDTLSNGGEGIVITKKGTKPEPNKRTARKTLKIKKELENTIDCFLTGRYKEAKKEYQGTTIETWNFWINTKTNEKYCQNKYKEYLQGGTVMPITKSYFYGWAGSIELGVYRDEKIIPIGWVSGLTNTIKKDIVENNENLKLKVCRATCMEIEKINGSSSMRHPTFLGFREDKTWKECDGSEIFD